MALGASKTVKVHTGSSNDTSTIKFQDRRAYVWNNDKDTAILRKSTGAKVDTCGYNSSTAVSKTC